MEFIIPKSLKLEHEELHGELARATKVGGKIGDYVRAIGIKDEEVIVIPAGHYNITGENLKKNNRVELLIASPRWQRKNFRGQEEPLL